MKKFIISESERERILGMHKSAKSKEYLMEYDIDDDNKMNFITELTSDGGSEIMSEIGITVTQDMSPETVADTMDNTEICQFTDMGTYAEQKFGAKVREKFGDKATELIGKIVEALNSFVEFIKNLNYKELKNLFRELKAKKNEAEQKVDDQDKMVVEFFGTTMALVTIGSFSMPALVLTIVSVTLVTLIGLYLLKTILCGFNISITSKKRCKVSSFEWGQCQ